MPLDIKTMQRKIDCVFQWEVSQTQHGEYLVIPPRLMLLIHKDIVRRCDEIGVDFADVADVLRQEANDLAWHRRESFKLELEIDEAVTLPVLMTIRVDSITYELHTPSEPQAAADDAEPLTDPMELHDECEPISKTQSLSLNS